MKPRTRTPQQRKALSLAKDRRNTYSERGANSRFAIARHKAKDLRSIRRQENTPLRLVSLAPSQEELDQAQLRAVSHPPRRWRKSADSPLSEAIERRQSRRATIVKAGGRRKARV
jgi:2-methylisocitrate lyase-like PEP mutase family enzyme